LTTLLLRYQSFGTVGTNDTNRVSYQLNLIYCFFTSAITQLHLPMRVTAPWPRLQYDEPLRYVRAARQAQQDHGSKVKKSVLG